MRLINLTFHGIGQPPHRLDPGARAVWVGHDEFLSVLDSVAGRPDVRITFDDGNASDVEHALPALLERGLRASFFVVADRIGTAGFVDSSGVRALDSAGMTVGSHGMRHRAWRNADAAALDEELVQARRRLEAVVGRDVTTAACPFGSYDRRVLRSLRRCGYQTVYTSDGGTARPGAWIQARTTVRSGDGPYVADGIAITDRRPRAAFARSAKGVAKRWR